MGVVVESEAGRVEWVRVGGSAREVKNMKASTGEIVTVNMKASTGEIVTSTVNMTASTGEIVTVNMEASTGEIVTVHV